MKLRQAKKIIKRVGGLIKFAFFIKHSGGPIFINKTQSEVKACLYFLRHALREKKKIRESYLK